jgi:hypothetical protein
VRIGLAQNRFELSSCGFAGNGQPLRGIAGADAGPDQGSEPGLGRRQSKNPDKIGLRRGGFRTDFGDGQQSPRSKERAALTGRARITSGDFPLR